MNTRTGATATPNVQHFAHDTWLQSEEFAYPNGGQTRRGRAMYPDGKIRRVYAGIPDTFYSIPAHGRLGRKYVRGYLTVDDRLLDCPNLPHTDGALDCDKCQFGLIDSPTRGALVFHIYEPTGDES